MPDGSYKGILVAIHDVPGRGEKDFLPIIEPLKERGIRYLGINLPGFGYSSYDSRLECDGNERKQFITTICRTLIKPHEKIIFMGHGRGTETAIKMTEIYKNDGAVGCIAVSPYGINDEHKYRHNFIATIHYLIMGLKDLGAHQIQPLLDISRYETLILFYPFILVYKSNNLSRLRFLKAGSRSSTVKTIQNISFLDVPEYLKDIEAAKQKFVILYGNSNKYVDPQLSLSLAKLLHECQYKELGKGEEIETLAWLSEQFSDSKNNVCIGVEYGKHTVFKRAPVFVADLIDVIFLYTELRRHFTIIE
uniref:Hydrolase_4 domain-containing protein n=1 Tax=Rhabditophanes sp. KR3021 TaxID=114890 RepID=A0AC35UI03_9BILA